MNSHLQLTTVVIGISFKSQRTLYFSQQIYLNMLKTAVAAATICSVSSLHVLPERMRGGKLADLVPSWKEVDSTAASEIYNAPLDHFNSSVSGTIPVRYWVDKSCWKEGGPVFVQMGGEGAAGPAYCSERERSHGAAAVSVEHRYYGESTPQVEKPLSVEYLKYLSVQQNAADTAAIMNIVKKQLSSSGDLKGFSFGGSYSGATCAWFRQKYPDVVAGCISLSGVVHAIHNYTEYDSTIAKAISHPDSLCPARLRNATLAFERAFSRGDGNRLKKMFNASNLIGTKLGDSDFFYALADAPASLDQYGNKAELCKYLGKLPETATDEQRIQNYNDLIDKYMGSAFASNCFYDSECLKNTTQGSASGVGNRPWRWQKCSELGYLQTAPTSGSLRSSKYLNISALTEQCTYVFGISEQQQLNAIKKFNSEHWDILEKEATNIMFLDFSDDPWQKASMTSGTSSLPFCMTTCDGCGHCGAGAGIHAMKCDNEADAMVTAWLK